MLNLFKKIVIFFFVVFFIMLSMLFTIKILAYKTAAPSGKIWNYSHSCYFVSYSPNYKPFGIAGRFLRFFLINLFLLFIVKMAIS